MTTQLANAPVKAPDEINELKQAFHEFVASTRQLESAYHDLQAHAGNMDTELNRTNRSLRDKVSALDEMTRYLNNLLGSMHNGVVAVDVEGRVMTMNPAAEQILGLSAAEAAGRPYAALLRTPPSALPIVRALESGKSFTCVRHELRRPDGRCVLLESSVSLIHNTRDQLVGALDIFRDLSHVRDLESRLRHADRLATLGKLAAGLAHEVRNPLHAVEGFARLLAQDMEEKDPRRRFAANIIAAVQNLEKTVSGMLIFARPFRLNLSRAHADRLVEDVADMLEQEIRHRTLKNMALEVALPASAPPIRADGEQLKRALLNLGHNALDAMPGGGRLSLQVLPPFADQEGIRYLRISVADTGAGIDPHILERLFEPFATSKPNGNGLGLAMVHKIIELHQGRITFETGPGSGTVFHVDIPVWTATEPLPLPER